MSNQIDVNKEIKSFDFEFKANEDKGIIEGYAAYFNNADSYNDIILKGAFKNAKPQHVKLFFNHEWHGVPIGTVNSLLEDEKGLKFSAKINDTALGKDVKVAIKDGSINKMSIGYSVLSSEYKTIDEIEYRYLTDINLFEISPVNFPANEKADIQSYKQDLPKHENNSNSNTNHKKSNPMTENDKKSFFGEIKDFLSGAMKEAKEAEIKAIADKKESDRIQKITDEHQEFKTQLETLKAENEALKAEKAEFEAKLKESQKEEKKEVDEKAEKIQALEMKLAEDQKALNELKGEIAENATADPEVDQDVVDKKSVEDAKYAEEVKFLNHLKTLK